MKRRVPVQQLVRWYYGNYCTRKCYNDEKKQNEHLPKLQELAQRMKGTLMLSFCTCYAPIELYVTCRMKSGRVGNFPGEAIVKSVGGWECEL